MSQIDDLQELLRRLPGIGPRQARRFVYFLLNADQHFIQALTHQIQNLRSQKHSCTFCRRLYFSESFDNDLCPTCSDVSRDLSKVMIIEKNSDFENINASGVWNGRYFLIYKNLGILQEDASEQLRLNTLRSQIEDGAISEIVIALSVNPEGEFTSQVITKELSELVGSHNLKLSQLARGLSTGSEIEYADSETLRLALKNREKTQK